MDISSATHKHNFTKWSMRSIKLVYFLNLCVGYAGLTYLVTRQANGHYRCSKFMVRFGDELWEGAHTNFNGKAEDRLLIYSHFNGIYEEDGESACNDIVLCDLGRRVVSNANCSILAAKVLMMVDQGMSSGTRRMGESFRKK